METEPNPKIENEVEKKKKEYTEDVEREMRVQLKKLTKEKLIENAEKELPHYLSETNPELKQQLESLKKTTDDDEFIKALMEILSPMISLKFGDPKRFETIERAIVIERTGHVKINDLLAYNYGENNDSISIHVLPAEFLDNKLQLLSEGMRELAKIVEND